MKIKKLHLQNFRLFSEISIEFDDSLTVIIGENGAGKTSVLDAIAIAFGRLLTKLPNIKGLSFKDTDIKTSGHHIQAPFTYYWIHTTDFSDNPIKWSHGKRRDSSKETANEIRRLIQKELVVGYKEIDKFADKLIDKFNRNEGYSMPVIVYYGTNRAMIDEVQRRRNFRKEYSRFESLGSALNPNARFKEAFEWFNAMEDLERRKQQEKRNFDYTLPELNAVRRAIESMLQGFKHPRTELRPLRFVIDKTRDDGSTLTLRINQLSDGYRVMLAMVMDLARRLAQANPPLEHDTGEGLDTTDPLRSPAIVLIDEIDLHLHPKWQQQVLPDLLRTFPKTQFIVTTHSPQVLSTVGNLNIRQIRMDNNVISVETPTFQTKGVSSIDVLEQIMGTHAIPKVEEAEWLSKYRQHIANNQWETPEAIALREQIERHFTTEHPEVNALCSEIEFKKLKNRLKTKKAE
jgi:predicted ATP-binding protein involved in virulence